MKIMNPINVFGYPTIPNFVFASGEKLGAEVSRSWCLIIEAWHPMRLNEGLKHWAKMQRGKKDAETLFTLAAKEAGCPPATGQRVLHLRLEGYRQKQHLPDGDAFDKVVLDGLKRAGLITDDNAEGVLGRMGFKAVLGKEKRTVLLIGDVKKARAER